MARARHARSPLVLAALLSSALLLPMLPVAADGMSPTPGFLFGARWEMAGAWIHDRAYFAGGQNFAVADERVSVYDPDVGGEAGIARCRLPFPTTRMASATDGTSLYLFGGITDAGVTDVVQRVTPSPTDPLACTASVVGRTWMPLMGSAAVWSGSQFYLFGGSEAASDHPTRFVTRFDPATGTAENLMLMWPPLTLASAVWVDGAAYVIGGSRGYAWNGIYRFDPAGPTMTGVAELPTGRHWASAVRAGEHVLVFGGEQETSTPTDEIVRFHPATREVVVMSAKLPTPRAGVAAAWDGARAHIAGGYRYDGAYRALSQIVTYHVVPPAPTSVTAVSGPSPGEITLTWTPPPANTYLTLSGYRVLRSTLADATPEQSVALDAPVGSSFVDRDLAPGIRYYYRVIAVSPQGASPPSEEASTRAAILPSGLEAAGARPLADPDGDALPTPVESPVCGTKAVRDVVNGMNPPFAGSCTETDYSATPYWDEDDDGVLDRAEVWLCGGTGDVELAGQCAGNDYGVTPRSWSEIVARTLVP